ncbi:sigma-70 factor domain-containing protein [Cupriavidus sp. CP313]
MARTTGPAHLYLREIGAIKLLAREEEVAIAMRQEAALAEMMAVMAACPARCVRTPGHGRKT